MPNHETAQSLPLTIQIDTPLARGKNGLVFPHGIWTAHPIEPDTNGRFDTIAGYPRYYSKGNIKIVRALMSKEGAITQPDEPIRDSMPVAMSQVAPDDDVCDLRDPVDALREYFLGLDEGGSHVTPREVRLYTDRGAVKSMLDALDTLRADTDFRRAEAAQLLEACLRPVLA